MLDREFGKYRLIRRLGRGGMADVYLANDSERNVEVALKLVEILPDRDSREICEAERRGVLLQEQFCHVDSHVPRVHGYGTLAGYFYIDMEYVEGEDLAERIASAPLPAEVAAWVAGEICSFLEQAHRFDAVLDDRQIRGIIHGDIKPRNVRLNRDGQVKVLDFGIAKGLALSRKLTRNDFGSLSYLSPERLDTGEVDPHVDYWSVGVLLYEMVTGGPPYQADSSQALEALIRSRQPPAPLPGTCPPALARIILKTLAGHPSRRYADAGLIRHDLEAFRRGLPTTADAEWMASQPDGDDTRRTAAPAVAEETRRTTLDEAPRAQETPSVAAEGASAVAAVPPLPAGTAAAEETRRTSAPTIVIDPAVDAEVTRRTLAAAIPPPLPDDVPAPDAAVPPPPGLLRRLRTWPRWAAALVLLTSIGLLVNEVSVWTAARRIRVGLATGQNSEMQGLWDEYQGLAHRSLLGIGLVGVRGPMKERLQSQADRVIADYRQDAPTVREAQWRDAATWLTDVLNLDPGDRPATARLRYCEGHLRRIDGETRKRKKLSAAEAFRDAVAKFEEAGRVDARWPDPYLGLARTYIYGLDDLDKAIESLKVAEQRGYRPGNRELVQLADGYKSRADRWRREAAAVKGLGQERDCLQKCADDYRQALELYQKAIGFGEASAGVRTIQARLDEVTKRLEQYQAPQGE
jgi:eukaryotic-like serine/threonine-protein kinase